MKTCALIVIIGIFISGCSLFRPKMQDINSCKQMVKIKNPAKNIVSISIEDENNKKRIGGSGVIINKNGTIFTAAHIFLNEENKVGIKGKKIFVIYNFEIWKEAKLVWISKSHDAAILKVDHDFGTAAQFGEFDLEPGACLYAVGYAPFSKKPVKTFGNFLGTIPISSKTFEIKNLTMFIGSFHSYPGMSGGAVFNSNGVPIGIISRIFLINGNEGSKACMFIPITYFKEGFLR